MKNYTLTYTLVQGAYWVTYCLMFNFASLYLQQKGFSAGEIGIALAVCYALSAVLQSVFAKIMAKFRLTVSNGIIIICAIATVMSLILLIPMGKLPTVVLFVLAITLINAMQPSVNSIPREIEAVGGKVHFGIARATGSTTYAITSLVIGILMETATGSILPAMYAVTAVITALSVRSMKLSGAAQSDSANASAPSGVIFRNYRFMMFLIGLVLLASSHIYFENFLLQIMQHIGGGSRELGIAIAISSAIELPAIVLYTQIRKKFSCPAILGFAGVVWVAKQFFYIVAQAPYVIYFGQILQGVSYALYVPAGVEFVAYALPREQYMQGQALLGTAFTVGCTISALLGGTLIELVGIDTSGIVMFGMCVVGTVFFLLAAIGKKQKAPAKIQ